MADATTASVTGGTGTPITGGAGAKIAGDGIVIDKNKTADLYMRESEGKYIVPRVVREKYPDLVKLLYETESMNDEEREYWLQIMPIMTVDQIVKLRDIMINERDQLQKLSSGYGKSMSLFGETQPQSFSGEAVAQKFEEIREKETASETEEKSKEDELLKQLSSF